MARTEWSRNSTPASPRRDLTGLLARRIEGWPLLRAAALRVDIVLDFVACEAGAPYSGLL